MADTRLIMGFLKELSRNNDRDWFHANKERFQQAQEHFLELIDALIPRLREVDLSIGPVRAADCAFRIYRDTRFANDKTPYKTHFGAYIAHGGRKSLRAGYYVHLDAEHPMAAGGLWQPSPQVLQAV
ncbi:MAG TPA: DUF2461 domain-containing protein, partial [Bacteroidales bacterium]|nr:DUF2461 domain-containing protein [Bacteroidales bacterium]